MENKYSSLREEIEYLIANAQNKNDLSFIGAKFRDVMDDKENKYNISDNDLWEYQMLAAKKMTQIYNQEKKLKNLSKKFAEFELEKVA